MTDPALFLQQLAYNALQETVGVGVRATLGGEGIEDLLKDGLINVGVGAISQFIATKIGINRLAELRSEHADLTDYLLHKAYHGILGAARGAVSAALRGDNAGQAALGGCLGGITAEVIAESMRESVQDRIFERITNGETDIGKIRSEELARVSCLGQGAAVIMASLFNCDIAQAQGAAANAIENNFIVALWPIAVGAMKLYDILTTMDGAIDAYDQGGMQALIDYGLDEGITRLLMGTSLKIVGTMINKARGVVRSTFKSTGSSSTSSTSSHVAKDVPVTEGKASAKNVASHEKHKQNLRRTMEKPHVEDPDLEQLINPLYRPNAKVGSGSTADALRFEKTTGHSVGGKFHNQKVLDTINGLERWLRKNPTAKPGDVAAAENILMDLKDAL